MAEFMVIHSYVFLVYSFGFLCYLAFEFFLLTRLFFLYSLMFNTDSSTWVAHISGALCSLGTTRYT